MFEYAPSQTIISVYSLMSRADYVCTTSHGGYSGSHDSTPHHVIVDILRVQKSRDVNPLAASSWSNSRSSL